MKIQIFMFGLFVVTTLAQDESVIGTNSRRDNENRVGVNSDPLKHECNGHHGYSRFHGRPHTHSPEWHRRHRFPMPPNEGHTTTTTVANDERGHRQFTHDREWHRRLGLPMPGDRNHGHRHTDISTSTPSATTTRTRTTPTRSTTTPVPRTTTTTATRRTTTRATPEYSREIDDVERSKEYYDEIEMVNPRILP